MDFVIKTYLKNRGFVTKECFQNRNSKDKNHSGISFPQYIFFISGLINPELIRCVPKNMFQKYFGKRNLEIIFKRGKTVFLKNDGMQEKNCC